MQTLKIIQHERWKEKTFWKQASSNAVGFGLTHWSHNIIFHFRVSFMSAEILPFTSEFNDVWFEDRSLD